MIKHIVMWKLNAQDEAGKAAAIAEIASVLEPLANVIDGVGSLKIHANDAYHEANYDVVLVGEYDDLAALDAYQVHPEHQAAVTIVRSHTSARASVDYEA